MNEVIEAGRILTVKEYSGGYGLVRIAAPICAREIKPGQYLQLNGQSWAVMRAGADSGWVDCFQPNHSQPFKPDAEVGVNGPLGEAFNVEKATPRALLLGEEEGIAPLVFLADVLRHRRPRIKPLLFMAAGHSFSFRLQPSRIMVPGIPAWVIAAIPLLEDWGIPSRLVSPEGLPGCFDGTLEELARSWLKVLQGAADVTLFACGCRDFLTHIHRLAADYGLACQTVTANLFDHSRKFAS